MTATPSSPMTKPALEPVELLGLAMAAKTLLPRGLMVKSRASVDASCARAAHTRTRRTNDRTVVLCMARYGIAQKEKTKELHSSRRAQRSQRRVGKVSGDGFCTRPCLQQHPYRFFRAP